MNNKKEKKMPKWDLNPVLKFIKHSSYQLSSATSWENMDIIVYLTLT